MRKVIVALPGNNFSGTFLKQWSQALMHLQNKGYTVMLSNEYSSFVTFSRMKCLGLDVLRGVEQKPFNNGQLDYDVFVTIDSDIFFLPEQLIELIEGCATQYPVYSGVYRMADMKSYACVEHWDEDYFKEHGSFQFMTMKDFDEKKDQGPFKVAYNGMGFMAIRKGVLENLRYPFFDQPLQEMTLADGTILRDLCSEDVALCKNLKEAGYPVWVDLKLMVGHEKKLII